MVYVKQKCKTFIKLYSKFLLLAVLLIGTVVSLIIVFNGAIAWFANNLQVTGTGIQTSVKDFEAEAEYYTYIYDVKSEDVHYTGQTVDKNGAAINFTPPTLQNLEMQFYDTIFRVRNRHTPAIVRIRLTGMADEWEDGGNVSITLTRDTSIAEYETENGDRKLNEYLTSMMRFSLAQDKTWYNANAITMFNSVDSVLYPKIVTNKNYSPAGSSAVFTSVTMENDEIADISKTDSITLTTSYSSTDIVSGHLDIYMFITYDEDLVSKYDLSNMNIEGTAVAHVTTLENDLKLLSISFSESN
ncbi:MAG: hypothetical protein E7254_06665 [Lachnospiraceae bacterium]|nr:hypothetical protein [Lachnospiraceae bacterium]